VGCRDHRRFASPGVSLPARVEVFDAGGNRLVDYEEFTEFADL
jgi:hypothetical protein